MNSRLASPLSWKIVGPLIAFLSIISFPYTFRLFKKIASRYFYYTFDPRLKAGAERMAVNLGIQGTAADIIKMAMKEINNLDCKLLLQIYDELLFEIREDTIKLIAPKIKQIMEGIQGLKVSLRVELKTGHNWGEMRK